jgi:hypothetical protein
MEAFESAGRLVFAPDAHLFGAGGAFGHPSPRILGAEAAVANIVQRRCIGIGLRLGGAVEVELKLRGNGHG